MKTALIPPNNFWRDEGGRPTFGRCPRQPHDGFWISLGLHNVVNQSPAEVAAFALKLVVQQRHPVMQFLRRWLPPRELDEQELHVDPRIALTALEAFRRSHDPDLGIAKAS